MKKQITALLALLAVAPLAFGQNPSAQRSAAPKPAASKITVASQNALSPAAFGYNTQTLRGPGWDKKPFLDRIAQLDPGNFRYPGGTVGNYWDWKTGYLNEIGRQRGVMSTSKNGPFPYMLEDVKRVYDRSGGRAEPIYMLNMLTSTYEYQLEMLKHARAIGLPVRYIELGNEFYMDNHPKGYTNLTNYPNIKDYVDTCRIWVPKLRKEFPGARFAMIAINNPSGWTGANRQRSRDWNREVIENMGDLEVEAFTFHSYAKNTYEDQTPADMIAQSLAQVDFSGNDRGIPAKYTFWVTEYNFYQVDNRLPGLWVTGLANVLMTGNMLATPGIELVCLHNITASDISTAIYDQPVKIFGGNMTEKYALSASGQALKVFAQGEHGATAIKKLAFSNNPAYPGRGGKGHSEYNALYGYLFTGAGDKAVLVNVGDKPMTVELAGLGFKPASAEQTWAESLATPVVNDNSVKKETIPLTGKGQLVLRPCSVTLVK